LEAVSARKDEVQYHKVEFLRADQKEAFFSCACNDIVVLLALQALLQGAGNFCFIFNDENSQGFTPETVSVRRMSDD